MLTRKGGPTDLGRNPITSFLTAQLQHTLLALELPRLADTRLALPLRLVNKRKVYSFQLQDMDALSCFFLSLPLCVLPSSEVVAVSHAPSPESSRKRTGQKRGSLVTKSDQQFIRKSPRTRLKVEGKGGACVVCDVM